MRTIETWLGRKPLWMFAMIIYAAGFGGWTAAVYFDASLYGGQRAGMGFQHGQFSYPDALVNAAGLTIAVVGLEWRRRRRDAKAQAAGSPDAAPPSTCS